MLSAAPAPPCVRSCLRRGRVDWPTSRLLARRLPGRAAATRAESSGTSLDDSGNSDGEERRGRGATTVAPAAGAQLGAGLLQTIWGDRPQTDGPLNYAQMLEYLQNKRVLRLMIYDNGKNAIGAATAYQSLKFISAHFEVCVPGYEDEPYEKMEKQRFTVALPGDHQAEVLRLAKLADRKAARPESGNVACRLIIVDPAEQLPPLVMSGKKKNLRKEMASEFGRSRAARTVGFGRGNTGVLFEDVAGQETAISQFREIIAMMHGDTRFALSGASLPKGVLLEGPPGTGKTLLAKAVAGEAGVPFFSANGSEFVEMFVGVASSRVRDLFRRARASAPSIVFIDEVDTIGRARTGSSDPGSREREQGLLQLLVEMDGFDTKSTSVLVIGATNRKDVLDPALLRSGRFDRVLRVDRPDATGRFDVLKVHAAGKIIPRGLDSVSEEHPEGDALLKATAAMTVGYAGADLANLLNEAAILAVRRNKAAVEMDEIETAMEKISIGLPRPPLPKGEYKRRLATVYAARAICQSAWPDVAPQVLQVSVMPRGTAIGRVESMPREPNDPRGAPRCWDDFMGRIALQLVGRIAEEVLCNGAGGDAGGDADWPGADAFGAGGGPGDGGATTLTARDVQAATAMAAEAVGTSGLFRSSALGVDFTSMTFTEDELARWPAVRDRFDAAVRETVDEAARRARRVVRERRGAIEALAGELEERDTVYGARIRQILRDTPVRALPLEALAAAPRASEEPTAPGIVTFGARGAGRCGLLSFSRAARPLWRAFQPPQPPMESGMGVASFGLGGPANRGSVGLAVFSGWKAPRRAPPAALAAAAAAEAGAGVANGGAAGAAASVPGGARPASEPVVGSGGSLSGRQ